MADFAYLMAIRKLQFKIAPELQGSRLDHTLAALLPETLGEPVSKARVRMLIVAGAVYLNGSRVRIASKTLIAGAKIDVYLDQAKLREKTLPKQTQFKITEKDLLFEDEDLIVVNKPAGIPTQPTLDEARNNLFGAVKKFLAARDPSKSDPYLGLHHRLDLETSGAILFTKTSRANPGVADAFSKHRARKVYYAVCKLSPRAEAPKATWVTRNYLSRLPGPGKRAKMGSVKSGGDPAETQFKVIESASNLFWIEARPITGRTHQIRVHLSEQGLPILGDPFYDPAQKDRPLAPRVMLHAVSLTFEHPIHKTEVSISSPLPEDFIQCLRNCRLPVELPR